MQDSIVRIVGLSHRYTSAWAVDNINLDIKKKGIYGLLGSNGAGKSTTMNILCGALSQTMGDVYVNGVDMKRDPIRAKKHIGFLPQNAPLYLDLTVYEYLLYCSRLREIQDRAIEQAIAEVMQKCSIDNVRNRLLKNLSGGYRQRVGIAQAIVHKPDVVILDEPTNGLDPLQIIDVRNLIKEIAQGRTVILSSHILNEIQLLCRDIIMIEQGKLVFSDSMEVFNNYIAPESFLADFENPPSEYSLAALKGVTRVERLTTGSFRVFYDGSRAVSETVIAESVRQGWRMTQLAVEKSSIDEVFKQLSTGSNTNKA